MSLETYTAAVTRGVQPRFTSASAFFEHTSEGKQILSAIRVQVRETHEDFISFKTSSMERWSKRQALESLLSEQSLTHYRDPDAVAMFYEKLVALPCEQWEKYLHTEMAMEARRLGRLRQAVLVDLLSLSVLSSRQNHPPAPAALKKLYAECEEKEAIQTSLKLELSQDPLLFTKGRSYVLRMICSFPSWGTSLTIEEKVTCNAPRIHCAYRRLYLKKKFR